MPLNLTGTSKRPSSSAPSGSSGKSAKPQPSGPTPWPALIPLGHHAGKPPIPLMRPVTLIGSRHNAHLHLLSRQISKAHALLISHEGKVYIRDLASRTHVYINGAEVHEGDLADGDMIKLGSFTFKFQAASGMKQKSRADETPEGHLAIEGEAYPLAIQQRVMLVGRRPTCDVPLVEDSCSTAHAVIFSMGGKRFVRDLGSRTGTYVNGKPVRQQEIQFGDTIQIGETPMRYEAAPASHSAAAAEVDEFEDLVGTAPLVGSGFVHEEAAEEHPLEIEQGEPLPMGKLQQKTDDHDPLHASEADFDLDGDLDAAAPKASGDTVAIPVTDELREKKRGKREDLPLAVEEVAEAQPPQTLVGDNLMGEKLTSSGTGAGMQAAAREAMEMARRAELREAARPFDSAPVPMIDDLPFAQTPVDEAPADPPVVQEPVDLDVIEPDAIAPEPVAEEAAPTPLSEDELMADLMPAPAPESAKEIPVDETPAEEIAEEIEVTAEAPETSELVAEIAPAEEEAVEEPAVEEIPVDEVPAEEAAVEEAPVEEVAVVAEPVEETPVEDATVEAAPAEEAAVEEAPVEEVAVAAEPVEAAPVEDAPVEAATVEEAPVEEAPVEEAPVEEAPVEEAPVAKAPVEAPTEKPRKRRGWFGWGKRKEKQVEESPKAPERPGMAGHFSEPRILDEPFDVPVVRRVDSTPVSSSELGADDLEFADVLNAAPPPAANDHEPIDADVVGETGDGVNDLYAPESLTYGGAPAAEPVAEVPVEEEVAEAEMVAEQVDEPVADEPVEVEVEQPELEAEIPAEAATELPIEESVEETVAEEPATEAQPAEPEILEEAIGEEPLAEPTAVEPELVEEATVEESFIEEAPVEAEMTEEPVAEEPAVEPEAVEEAVPEEPAAEPEAINEAVIEETILSEPAGEEASETSVAEVPDEASVEAHFSGIPATPEVYSSIAETPEEPQLAVDYVAAAPGIETPVEPEAIEASEAPEVANDFQGRAVPSPESGTEGPAESTEDRAEDSPVLKAASPEPEAEIFFGDETIDEIIHADAHRNEDELEFEIPSTPSEPPVAEAVMEEPPPVTETAHEEAAPEPVAAVDVEPEPSIEPAVEPAGEFVMTSAASLAASEVAEDDVSHSVPDDELAQEQTIAPSAPIDEAVDTLVAEPISEVAESGHVEVVEPTEPTQESAFPLEVAGEAVGEPSAIAPESPELEAADIGLSDTSFNRQVEEFAGAAIDAPILDAPATEEAVEESAEASEVVEDVAAEPTEVEALADEEMAVAETPVIEEPLDEAGITDEDDAGITDEIDQPEVIESISTEEIAEEIEPTETPITEAVEEEVVEEAPAEAAAEHVEEHVEETPVTEAPPEAPMGRIQIPGMSLFEPKSSVPDFIGGMPLLLNEIPPPPPTFGRVQVSFAQDEPAEPLLDDLVEASPFENMDVDGMLPPGALPVKAIDGPGEIAELPEETEISESPAEAEMELPAEESAETSETIDDAIDEALIELPPEEPAEFAEEPVEIGAKAESPVEALPEVSEVEEIPAEELPADEIPAEADAEAAEPEVAETEVAEPELAAAETAEPEPAQAAPEGEPIEAVAEAAPEAVGEPAPVEPPVRSLFQNKMRVPPAARKKVEPTPEPIAAPEGFGESSAAPGGFGQAANIFGGLTASARNVDVFSQGLSADLSNDPFFGAAVKPIPPAIDELTGAPVRRLRDGRKGKAPAAPPAPADMAGPPTGAAGAPPLPPLKRNSLTGPRLAPQRPDRSELAPARSRGGGALLESPEAAEASLPTAALHRPPAFTPAGAMPSPRRGRRVGILLTIMVLMMVAAFVSIYTFMKQRVAVTGTISFENFGKLNRSDQNRLTQQQNAIMISETLRTVARNTFRSKFPKLPEGFLGDRLDFAKNEAGVRVQWQPATGTMVYNYVGSDKTDADRVRAVLEGLYLLDADLISAAGRNRQELLNLRKEIEKRQQDLEALTARRKEAQHTIESAPADEQIRALTAQKDSAEKIWKDAVSAVNAAEAELKRIEQASSLAPSPAPGTDPADSIAATAKPAPSGDPDLDELQKGLEQAIVRLNTARNTVAEQAESARKALDGALEQFQQSTNVVQGIIKENPELSAFVIAAQRLQETTQKLSGDLLDRQQKNYEHLTEEKRYLDDRLAARRKELWEGDKEIKRLKDDLGMRERGYEAARANDYVKEAAEIRQQMDASIGKIAQRKMELENDPILMTLNEFSAKRQQEITAAEKLLEADRKQAEALTKEMEKSLGQLSPTVEKLPEEQRKMAMQMTSKMEIVANARKAYAEALEAKNAEANSGLKMIEEQVRLKAAQVEERKKTLAALNSQQMTVEERQQRQAFVDQKRAAFDSLKKAETVAYNQYFEKEKAARQAQAEASSALKLQDELTKLTDDVFNLRDKEMPVLQGQLQQKEMMAGLTAYPTEPKVLDPVVSVDQRLLYSLGSMAAIALVFSLLFALTGGRDSHPPAFYNEPQIALNFTRRGDVEPLTGVGIRNPESPDAIANAEHAEAESAVA